MSVKIVAALAGAVLLGSTALASAQQEAVPQDRYWGDNGYYGLGPPPVPFQFGVAPYAYYPGYYNYAPSYYPGYYPGNYYGWRSDTW
jgi:hypothetical protein